MADAGDSEQLASPDITALAHTLSAIHDRDGGVSFHPQRGNLSGQPLYAVAVYPDRARILQGRRVTPARFAQYLTANLDLLQQPDTCIGSWYNPEDGLTYLDISQLVSDRVEATELAVKHDQLAIYDLQQSVAIYTRDETESP